MTTMEIVRLEKLPDTCPNCERKRDQFSTRLGTRWVHYRLIPGSPAAGCGDCGHIVYLTPEVYGAVRDSARASAPKAADGKITKNFNKRRRH